MANPSIDRRVHCNHDRAIRLNLASLNPPWESVHQHSNMLELVQNRRNLEKMKPNSQIFPDISRYFQIFLLELYSFPLFPSKNPDIAIISSHGLLSLLDLWAVSERWLIPTRREKIGDVGWWWWFVFDIHHIFTIYSPYIHHIFTVYSPYIHHYSLYIGIYIYILIILTIYIYYIWLIFVGELFGWSIVYGPY